VLLVPVPSRCRALSGRRPRGYLEKVVVDSPTCSGSTAADPHLSDLHGDPMNASVLLRSRSWTRDAPGQRLQAAPARRELRADRAGRDDDAGIDGAGGAVRLFLCVVFTLLRRSGLKVGQVMEASIRSPSSRSAWRGSTAGDPRCWRT
jgi:hypothetical protein